ncbi:MAG: PQQ-binding-like beta-propeller repeat protein [Planctomycetales bacterium]
MISWRVLPSMLCCLAACLPAARGQSQRTESVLPSPRELGRHGLVLDWHNHATMDPQRDHVLHMTSDEDTLYVQATVGTITAFDIETGLKRWAVQLGRRDRTSHPAVSNEALVLVSSGMQLFALDKTTGRTQWTIQLPTHPSTSPAIDSERIYIGSLDGSVYALDLKQIRRLYDMDRLPQWSHQTIAWRYQADSEVTTPPVVTPRVVSFASRRGSLYSVSANNRKLVFQFETDKPVSAPMATSGPLLFLASEDFNFYALDSENGRVRWEFVTGLPIRMQPSVIDEDVYLTPTRGGLHSLKTATGRRRWWNADASQFLAATAATVFASDHLGNVLLLSRETGRPVGALPLRHYAARFSNDRTDRLFVATDSGRVLCIHEEGRDFPHYHRFPERKPILPEFTPEEPEEPATNAASP